MAGRAFHSGDVRDVSTLVGLGSTTETWSWRIHKGPNGLCGRVDLKMLRNLSMVRFRIWTIYGPLLPALFHTIGWSVTVQSEVLRSTRRQRHSRSCSLALHFLLRLPPSNIHPFRHTYRHPGRFGFEVQNSINQNCVESMWMNLYECMNGTVLFEVCVNVHLPLHVPFWQEASRQLQVDRFGKSVLN